MRFVSARFGEADVSYTRSQGWAEFSLVHTTGQLNMSGAVFEGGAVLIGANIGTDLELTDAEFRGGRETVKLESLSVSGDILMGEGMFEGPVEISATKIGGDLAARHTRFLGRDKALIVEGAKIGGSADLSYSLIRGSLLVARSDVNVFRASIMPQGAAEASIVMPVLTIADSTIKSTLTLEGFKVRGFYLMKSRVDGVAEVSDVAVLDKAEIIGVIVKELRLKSVSWPTNQQDVVFQRNAYSEMVIRRGNERSSWETVVGFLRGRYMTGRHTRRTRKR